MEVGVGVGLGMDGWLRGRRGWMKWDALEVVKFI